jgi:MIP family channel proteins
MYNRPQKLAAELVGMFAVVLVSAGVICASQSLKIAGKDSIGPLGIALAYGLTFGVFVAVTGPISGGHLNPAVTVGHWVTRRLGLFDTINYMCAQLAGASLAGYLLRAIIPEETWRAVALGTPDLASGLTRAPGMLIEGILTSILVFAIFAATPDSSASSAATFTSAGVIAGLLLTALALFGGPFTGAAMNPARVFGPALAARHWTNHGVYWVGPLAGGAFGAAICRSIFPPRHPRNAEPSSESPRSM